MWPPTAGVGTTGCGSDGSGDGDGGDEGGNSGNDSTESSGGTDTTDDNGSGGGDDTSTTESGENGQTSGREVSGEVSNDLTGFEVLEHNVTVGDDSFSGFVTLRNVGNETSNVVSHQMEIKLFDDGGGILDAVGSIKIKSGSSGPSPGEEVVLDFSPGPTVDTEFSEVASYEVVMTCAVTNRGVYCP